jgi:Loader and inhibitor of phage G40P
VRPDEAAALLKLLRAAYPDAQRRVGEDTAELWLAELLPLDQALGEQAVRSLIESERRWPPIAALREQLAVAREQAARERRDWERQEENRMLLEADYPPLAEIPAVEELRKLLSSHDETSGLDEAAPGICEQCGKTDERRFFYGRFTLCRDCLRSRRYVGLGGVPQRDPRAAERLQRWRRERERERKPRSRSACAFCSKPLRPHEAAEGVCDHCLRSAGGGPTFRDNPKEGDA